MRLIEIYFFSNNSKLKSLQNDVQILIDFLRLMALTKCY